jgi:hypothetical protein
MWVLAIVLSFTSSIVALSTHTRDLIPAALSLSFFWIIDCSVHSFTDDFSGSKNPALVRLIVLGSMQIVTGCAVAVSAIMGNVSMAWLWGIVTALFLYCGTMNVAEAVPLWKKDSYARANERKLAAQSAIIEAFQQMAEEEKEKKIKESLLAEDSLLESLAFLADIEPKNK